jgi:alpha-tubulin suppressor-like RCC1 family protein
VRVLLTTDHGLLCRVAGQLSDLPVRQVAAGTTFTVALTATGRVFQTGETGAAGGKVPWEGTLSPELVSKPVAACLRVCSIFHTKQLHLRQCSVHALFTG